PISLPRLLLQRFDDARQREQLARIVRGQAIGGHREGGGVREVGGEIARAVGGVIGGGTKFAQEGVDGIDRFQRGAVTSQPLRLLRQSEAEGGGPSDVGSPVHVVADPGGEAERQRV